MNSIILIGSSGFLGKHLLLKLQKEKYQIKSMIHTNGVKNALTFKGDLLSKETFENEISDGDIVINAAGQLNHNFSNFIDVNIRGNYNLLDVCSSKKNVKLILISSIDVYGQNLHHASKEVDKKLPLTSYGITKSLVEDLFQYYTHIFNLDVTILRLSNLYGTDKKTGIISNILESLNHGKQLTIFHNGNQQRDFIFVDDAVSCMMNIIKKIPRGFNIFNLSTGKRYSINKIILILENLTNKKLFTKLNSNTPDEQCVWADNSKITNFFNLTLQSDLELNLKKFNLN
jgi:nucleoside-diphosphate-sugar epimerase